MKAIENVKRVISEESKIKKNDAIDVDNDLWGEIRICLECSGWDLEIEWTGLVDFTDSKLILYVLVVLYTIVLSIIYIKKLLFTTQ